MPTGTTSRMPTIYLSHGAPPLVDDPLWTEQLASWAAELPRPKAVLVVSAHWEEAPLAIGATTTVPMVHDFWGFPERYYRCILRPEPGATACAPCCTPNPAGPDRGPTTAPMCR